MEISLAALELEWSTTPTQAARFEREMAARGFQKDGGRKWRVLSKYKDPQAAERAVRSAAHASKVSVREVAFGEGQAEPNREIADLPRQDIVRICD